MLVTPLQLANGYATFANGGTLYQPAIVAGGHARQRRAPGGQLGDVVHAVDPQMLATTGLTPEVRNPILEGLIGVVNNGEGTAYFAFRNYTGPTFVGKTGTAQVAAASRTRRGSSASPTRRTIPRFRSTWSSRWWSRPASGPRSRRPSCAASSTT